MIMSVEGGLHGNLAHRAQRLHLEGGSRWSREAFNEKRRVSADKKSAVAQRRQALRRIRNGRVQTVADFPYCGEALVHQRRLRNAGVAR